MMVPEYLGHPLIVGDELMATAASDLFFRWTPGVNAFMMRLHHPLPGMDLTLSPEAKFGGYPPVATPSGIIVGEDATYRFMTSVNGFPSTLWHRDIDHTLGVPSVDRGTIFTGIGGIHASRGIGAIDGATGKPMWAYKPEGLATDPQDIVMVPASRQLQVYNGPISDLMRGSTLVSGPNGRLPGVTRPAGAPSRATQATSGQTRPGFALQDRFNPLAPQPGGATTRAFPTPPVFSRPGTTNAQAGPQGSNPFLSPATPSFTPGRNSSLPTRSPIRNVNVKVLGPVSRYAYGHWNNGGLAISGGKVYGEVNHTVVCLDQDTGSVAWRHELAPRAIVRSVVATPEHLVLCVSVPDVGGAVPVFQPESAKGQHRLLFLKLQDGKEVWSTPVTRPGNLSLALGLVFFANGDLHVYGPAERTYYLAADSREPEDYRATREENDAPEGAPDLAAANSCDEKATAGDPQKAAGGKEAPKDPAVADASFLRLSWNEPVADLQRKVRDRLDIAPGVPLLLSLEWLNATRSGMVGTSAAVSWTPEQRTAFAQACAALAAEGKPAHFDVAPEINVYLARHPEQSEGVRLLVQEAKAAIQRRSPGTRVLVSLNWEMVNEKYGYGNWSLFGDVAPPRKAGLTRLQALLDAVDEVGFTSYPQSAFRAWTDMPPDYLLRIRDLLPEKPLLLTQVAARCEERLPTQGPIEQAVVLKRLIQAVYWLDARVVAYPTLVTEAKEHPTALRLGGRPRLGLMLWQDALRYKRVKRLSAAPPGKA